MFIVSNCDYVASFQVARWCCGTGFMAIAVCQGRAYDHTGAEFDHNLWQFTATNGRLSLMILVWLFCFMSFVI